MDGLADLSVLVDLTEAVLSFLFLRLGFWDQSTLLKGSNRGDLQAAFQSRSCPGAQ